MNTVQFASSHHQNEVNFETSMNCGRDWLLLYG